MRVGVLGGSFDPIHLGHLAAAEDAADALSLDRVLLVPASVPPHKLQGTSAPPEERLAMVREAVKGHDRLEACDIEIRRGGISYTIDTVNELFARFGRDVELWLLVGSDAFRDIASWRRADELLQMVKLAVLERPGESLPTVSGVPRPTVVKLPNGLCISSTEVRRRLASGEPISGLLPPAVELYIKTRGLYRSPSLQVRTEGGFG